MHKSKWYNHVHRGLIHVTKGYTSLHALGCKITDCMYQSSGHVIDIDVAVIRS